MLPQSYVQPIQCSIYYNKSIYANRIQKWVWLQLMSVLYWEVWKHSWISPTQCSVTVLLFQKGLLKQRRRERFCWKVWDNHGTSALLEPKRSLDLSVLFIPVNTSASSRPPCRVDVTVWLCGALQCNHAKNKEWYQRLFLLCFPLPLPLSPYGCKALNERKRKKNKKKNANKLWHVNSADRASLPKFSQIYLIDNSV